tara:strand:- start:2248 stop:2586 length:339 start_codon:yes stop_codon:yes gene_type:complete
MGAKGTKNGERKKYTLDDGRVVDVIDVSKTVPCSLSLALSRLNTSTDPKLVFMEKGIKIKGGHKYCQLAKIRIHKKHGPPKKTKKVSGKKHYRNGNIKPFYDPLLRLALKVI